ncbi:MULTISPECIES: DUF3043 domain-containing protein [unclassified Bifidobacterium]|uniref:DUF3043 domain-containing protein n=1 Tax=unclassified Bifidobacterium TaxID=2608897 RepID=UPI0011292CC8|nr:MULTISPECIES: DUF3043 domain-containing protein [unclassified Bifidobacterium]TPF79132.1 membrane protein [Bifidobacterium sp. UTCIF-1]TPF81003.1 membrane protein [Bifidobacterium sp. UTCIF-24]TPF83200.1 membrane protein [Bifidobacterium sp. UTCIF-3]TPF85039.1 membrane protein [Bifidobacterium sp. UTCIF-36]TPF90323.1 membrane protein [Bifidobacterium sp. UTBIF-56]
MTWNPFKKKEEAQAPVEQAAPQKNPSEGKGRPTPKMKKAQAAGIRPLVPANRKASAKAAKARMRERENAEYEAMQKGDINHMPKAERLPWRIYIRDYVDARINLGEWFIPVAFGILIVSMVVSSLFPNAWASLIMMIIMYGYLAAIIIDVWLMWRKLKPKLIAKYGEASVAKGSRSLTYAWSRSIQMRRWRLPKPRYPKRGHWPED